MGTVDAKRHEKMLERLRTLDPRWARAHHPCERDEGFMDLSIFIREESANEALWVGFVDRYLVHLQVNNEWLNANAQIILQSPFVFAAWDEKGLIEFWAAFQHKKDKEDHCYC